MAMSEALKECYASQPVDEYPLDTIELLHPSFVDDLGNPTSILAVRAFESWMLTLEVDAPLRPGQTLEFLPIPFDITSPGFAEGEVPKLVFSISNVSRLVSQYLERAISMTDPITVIYRQYLNTDTTVPQTDPPIIMELSSASSSVTTVSGTATLSDVHNWPFPWQRYTTKRFPGLVR